MSCQPPNAACSIFHLLDHCSLFLFEFEHSCFWKLLLLLHLLLLLCSIINHDFSLVNRLLITSRHVYKWANAVILHIDGALLIGINRTQLRQSLLQNSISYRFKLSGLRFRTTFAFVTFNRGASFLFLRLRATDR